ncbi:MAG: hypothetical protein IJ224_08585 [Lachnospiraceae bacterium]|nr:hypothetical protein [Lachnospiraceae bacterium]
MKKLYQNISLSALIISLILSLPACGKKNNDISDYGTEAVASQEDADDEAGISDEYGSLSDKLGTDKIDWQESFSANGINYKINLMYDVPDKDNVPVYTTKLITNLDEREKEIVDNIFGDNYEEVHEIIKDGDVSKKIFDIWYGESGLGRVADSDSFIDYEEAYKKNEFFNSWNKYENFSLHTYKGLYDETEYYAVFSRYEDDNYIVLRFIKDDIADFVDVENMNGYGYYNGVIWGNSLDEYGNYIEKGMTYEEKDNIAYDVKEKLEEKAINFSNSVVGGNHYKIGGTGDLGYYGYDNKGLYGDIIKFDGYRFAMINDIVEGGIYDGTDLYSYFRAHEQECCEISSEGFLYACIGVFCDEIEIKSLDTAMLDFENIKEAIRDCIENKIDVSKLDINYINIDTIDLKYYPFQNPQNEKEYTMIPVWWVNCSTKNFMMIINAVDGSLLYLNN